MTFSVDSKYSSMTYIASLGVDVGASEDESVELRLPYRADNANPTGIPHGGVVATLCIESSRRLVARASEERAIRMAGVHINYVGAYPSAELVARASLTRQAKTLAFATVRVETAAGEPVASSSTLHQIGSDFSLASAKPSIVPVKASVEPAWRERIRANRYVAGRAMMLTAQEQGRSVMTLPALSQNLDISGRIHEGAAAALADTTGAMAAWSLVTSSNARAATPALQMQFIRDLPTTDLVGIGQVVARNKDVFWVDVELADIEGRLVARGTVIYRIVES